MASPDPKRSRRTVPAESTPISLHAMDCTESPEDLQRMRDLLEKDPSLLYKLQPQVVTLRNEEDVDDDDELMIAFEEIRIAMYQLNQKIPPLWDACRVQHLACVNFILQASDNIKLLEDFTCLGENILSLSLLYGERGEKGCKIIKSLLGHGVSPNVEIDDLTEIRNPQIVQVLEQYKVTKLIFPSRAFYLALKKGYSENLELLFEHGAYPEPVVLTESGSVLPLYPTLGKHLNPIPTIEHPCLQKEGTSDTLLYDFICIGNLQQIKSIKTVLVHGVSIPPYYSKKSHMGSQILSNVLFPFHVILRISRFKVNSPICHTYYFGVKSDGSPCQYYEFFLEILKLYHQFGGSLWWKMKSEDVPCEGGTGECVEWLRDPERVTPCKTIIDLLEERIRDPVGQRMLVGEVERMMSTPPSLQHSARLAIRRSMGYGCVRNLEALPLPDHLKKYLKFEF